MMQILICEDEENIVSFLSAELNHEGYHVTAAMDGVTALELFHANKYDLILLDIMLPKKSGLLVLHEIRRSSNVPVIMLTARKDTIDKIAFLDAGADDYITKPFETLELLARIRRCISRNLNEVYSINGLELNQRSFQATLNGHPVSLTKTEFDILALLMKHVNKVLPRETIINSIYGEYYGDSNIVDVNIRNIRRKLETVSPNAYILTVRGRGYMVQGD